MNRIINAIDTMEKQIKDRVAQGLTTQDKVNAMHSTLDLAIDEYVSFQELKSMASVSEKITLEEAQTIYCYLGNVPEHFNTQPVAVKVVLTKVYQQLLEWKINMKRRAA